jgi:hypothetical protein
LVLERLSLALDTDIIDALATVCIRCYGNISRGVFLEEMVFCLELTSRILREMG